ncbi:uncharacterized protein K452DRAFT_230493 [Aplosporella prunicola CBS 121167]|uniref:UBA domain-containing protein n=1 Tax=Aplosporella prunicola CBS 121167 TaxID=1176127 RepID=A0A6A6B8C9_9PEZI|nr:uncharacterized protein K452DRAFT_230493 [Aplosporella prunicola CBS 121167]KAF2140409.1 hypothetical protein K452DRAFT_230493 [Aplosporella prunicola CBS 121167]
MDDLMGVDWNAPPAANPPQQSKPAASYSSMRASPIPSLSGRNTPMSAQSSGVPANPAFRGVKASKPATPDSFSSLLGSNKPQTPNNMSLQERQRQLMEEKQRKQKQLDSQFGGDTAFWNALESGRSTPSVAPAAAPLPKSNNPFASFNQPTPPPMQQQPPRKESEAEEDILAAFKAEAPVDASSHFPVPQSAIASRITSPTQPTYGGAGFAQANSGAMAFGDDDDPFGLGSMPPPKATAQAPPPAQSNGQDDDDILGDLGKPIDELPPRKPDTATPEPEIASSRGSSPAPRNDPRDAAVAELVDMGFPADKSAEALTRTESGTDIQAAVGWLLNQAHEEARQKSRQRHDEQGRASPFAEERERHRSEARRSTRNEYPDDAVPAWMRNDRSRSGSQRRQDSRTPTEEKDVAQYAQEFGSNLFKSANSLWKKGQKQIQKAVAELQDEGGDPSQPRWMREAQLQEAAERSASRARQNGDRSRDDFPEATNEAMMLESDMARPQRPTRPARAPQPDFEPSDPRSRGQSPVPVHAPPHRATPPPRFQESRQPPRPLGKLTREDVEEQSAQAYVSPARRKKATPKTQTPEPEVDLFSSPPPKSSSPASVRSPPLQSNNPFAPRPASVSKPATPKPSTPKPASTPIPTRPKAPPRQIPPASGSALSTSASQRAQGTDAFKRGDYAAAHTAYTSALSPLPPNHPIAIIVLCNRALTNIKVGDPKAAVADADTALGVIGVSRGEGETISLGTEGEKDMKEFFGKALMRKAEALENMEKWNDAAKVWREAVEAGVGGAVSIQGRNRCEKAAGGGAQQAAKPATPRPAAARKPAARPSPARPAVSQAASAEAVKKLREANAAAEKADDEKFALTDAVDAKLIAWKGSKADNLRALLGSLDTVLWPEAGWKKVGMADLVMPNKVKIIYMKAIAKVHPDKISQDATTEQRMVSAAVFATLNEAWDKFKKDNGL